jgi:uncharacterized RmlC-like cupin family protein
MRIAARTAAASSSGGRGASSRDRASATPVSDARRCVAVRAGADTPGATGLGYFAGISSESVGAEGLCLQLVRIPAGGRAKAHLHEGHETAAYVLEGEVVTWYGEGLRRHVLTGPGDFAYIPAGVPHLPVNYGSEDAVAVIARTDAKAQESVLALPELDELPHLLEPPPS